ncbi:GntR family transcriptional regulator [Oceanobacillus bengalensis]|uniref:GntR family transcriptional regulator n=1 Tax=Oceanobacillus bengalensis TaxID=1435466 RepID=A0A494YSP5_9BACI|nr:GntR family transcriptional regulator [Oceanobacillus bengalensis]RKQ13136.1 GntR family transcriptional regulator [Oceanobacillus bengalensis]
MKGLSLEKQEPYYIQFYHMIKKMIFDGKYLPGERINETQLAKEFNVSKSPIREAVRLLEKEGLLVIENGKVVVYKPTLKDVEEIYYCRMALESFAVKLVTKLASDSELEEIQQTLQATEEAIKAKKDSNTIINLNEQFHRFILTFTKNDRLQKQVNDLKGLINYFRVLNFKGERRAEEILEQHRGIYTLIKQREEEKAANEMIKHLELDVAHLLQVIANNDTFLTNR